MSRRSIFDDMPNISAFQPSLGCLASVMQVCVRLIVYFLIGALGFHFVFTAVKMLLAS